MYHPRMRAPQPPIPADLAEASRWEHTRLRRRMLDGQWADDLRARIRQAVGTTRSEAWASLDMSACPLRSIARELAVLYSAPPDVRHDDGSDAIAGLVDAVARSGLWAVMPRFQQWAIGCNEYLMRAHVDAVGSLRYRPVPPDMVTARASAADPATPVRVEELRLRTDPATGDLRWTWDVLDVSDPTAPQYRVLSADRDGGAPDDLTAVYLEDPGAYPYRRSDGSPVLPYVLYHASHTGDRLWDTYHGIEAVEGTLDLAMAGSLWLHVLKDASWPQRYAVGATPAAASAGPSGNAPRTEVVTDPATLMVLEALSEDQQPQVGQWKAGGDVESMGRSIDSYGTRMAQEAGVPPSDVQRLGGTARSGYAISLSNEGKRQAQRMYSGQFRESDAALMSLSAVLLNRATGSSYPERGYNIAYQEIPLSPQELEARRAHVLESMAAGLMSRVEAYIHLHPGISETQAAADLADIDAAPPTTHDT